MWYFSARASPSSTTRNGNSWLTRIWVALTGWARPRRSADSSAKASSPSETVEEIQRTVVQGLNLTGELTQPRPLEVTQRQVREVQLELPLERPIHLKNRRRLTAPELTRLRLKPREVREPSGLSGLDGIATIAPGGTLVQTPPVEDPLAVVEVRNELTGQAWRFKDIGSMYGPDGSFMLRGQWPPGLYRIENRTINSLKLTLWNETHSIAPGETWRFFAHSELGRKAELIERRRMH